MPWLTFSWRSFLRRVAREADQNKRFFKIGARGTKLPGRELTQSSRRSVVLPTLLRLTMPIVATHDVGKIADDRPVVVGEGNIFHIRHSCTALGRLQFNSTEPVASAVVRCSAFA